MPLKRIPAAAAEPARHPVIVARREEKGELLSLQVLSERHTEVVRSSWIEHFIKALHGARSPPTLQGPWPAPIPLQQNKLDLAFQGIHPRMYQASSRVFSVALRFWISRLHTQLALDGCGNNGSTRPDLYGPDVTMWPIIVRSEEISNEVWLIETQSLMRGEERVKRPLPTTVTKTSRNLSISRSLSIRSAEETPWIKTESFLVLSKTGEVIGRSSIGSEQNTQDDLVFDCNVRGDFLSYMAPLVKAQTSDDTTPANFLLARSSSSVKPRPTTTFQLPSISSFVKTKDCYSFPEGIARHWREEVERRGQDEALEVAERAVISSCMLHGYGLNSRGSLTVQT